MNEKVVCWPTVFSYPISSFFYYSGILRARYREKEKQDLGEKEKQRGKTPMFKTTLQRKELLHRRYEKKKSNTPGL